MDDRKGSSKQIILIILAVSLLITSLGVSYAWMANGRTFNQPVWELLYGMDSGNQIGVEKVNMTVNFYLRDENEEYILVKQPQENNAITKPLITCDRMLPSEAIHFMIEFYNMEEVQSTVNVTFSGIHAEKVKADGTPKLADALYVSLQDSDGYALRDQNLAPSGTYELASAITTYSKDLSGTLTGSMPFAKRLVIPPTGAEGEGTPIRVYGYIMFDRNAGVEFENCDFTIDGIFILG